MAERSPGKDSVTGHWELMGLLLERAFPVFPEGFPDETIREFERRIGRKTLGNVVASGTVIIEQLGEEHLRTGAPIVYTSADSVFQIAAHEDVIPVPELYRQCEIAYDMLVKGIGLGRVIARPFVGVPGSFRRTSNRHDFAIPPAGETVLDRLKAAGFPVFAIGKVDDLFAGQGVSGSSHTTSDDEGMDEVERALDHTPRGLIFANLVDFDTRLRAPQQRRGLRGEPRAVRRAACPNCCHASGPTTCWSSRRTMATTRRPRAPIIRASTCRCWRAGLASARGWTSARGRRSPTSGRRWPRCSASARSRTAPVSLTRSADTIR